MLAFLSVFNNHIAQKNSFDHNSSAVSDTHAVITKNLVVNQSPIMLFIRKGSSLIAITSDKKQIKTVNDKDCWKSGEDLPKSQCFSKILISSYCWILTKITDFFFSPTSETLFCSKNWIKIRFLFLLQTQKTFSE